MSLSLAGAGSALLDLVYPPICPSCGDENLALRAVLGPACLGKVRWAAGRDCLRCGRVLGPHAERDSCLDCRRRPFAFSQALAAAAYDGPVVDLVLRMKMRREAFWAEPLAGWLARRLADDRVPQTVDTVACVPTRLGARLARGFNPAELLARAVARSTGLPFSPGLLRCRLDPGPKQTDLARAARFKRAAQVFLPGRDASVEGARILLVDDVITTGATVDACARVLRGAGADGVIAAAVARAS